MITDLKRIREQGEIIIKNIPVFEASNGDRHAFHARKFFKIVNPKSGSRAVCEWELAIYGGMDGKLIYTFGIGIS